MVETGNENCKKPLLRLERRPGHRHYALTTNSGETIGFVYQTRRDEASNLLLNGEKHDCIGCAALERTRVLEHVCGRFVRIMKDANLDDETRMKKLSELAEETETHQL